MEKKLNILTETDHPSFGEGAIFGQIMYNKLYIFTGVLQSIDRYGFNIAKVDLTKAGDKFKNENPLEGVPTVRATYYAVLPNFTT
jgi:hypothetical protein